MEEWLKIKTVTKNRNKNTKLKQTKKILSGAENRGACEELFLSALITIHMSELLMILKTC